jgi:hypothetical protein
MRFRNSSHYFGLDGNIPRSMPLNSAIGKAFHALVKPEIVKAQDLNPLPRISAAANSAVAICSKVT